MSLRGFGRYAADENGHLVNPRFIKGLRDSQFPPIILPDNDQRAHRPDTVKKEESAA